MLIAFLYVLMGLYGCLQAFPSAPLPKRQQQPLAPYDDTDRNHDPLGNIREPRTQDGDKSVLRRQGDGSSADQEVRWVLVTLPKRGFTLLTHRDEEDPEDRSPALRSFGNLKNRKLIGAARPRGHPLRWG